MFLVDTPGFDDTSRSDAEILKEISFFLVVLQERGLHLAGLVYMHRISDPRMSGSAIKNLRIFKSLCGEQNYRHVTLTSTMWSNDDDDDDEKAVQRRRLEELRELFWSDMMRGGCSIRKHRGDAASALYIVRELVTRGISSRHPIKLAIQHELGVEGRTLDDTAAGKLLSQEILGDQERMVRELAELQLSLEQAQQSNNDDMAALIRGEQEAASARASERFRDFEGLGIRVSQLANELRPRYHRTIAHIQHEGRSGDEERHASSPEPRSSQNTSKPPKESPATRRRRRKRSVHKTRYHSSRSPDARMSESRQMEDSESRPQTSFPYFQGDWWGADLLNWIIKSYF